MMDQRNSKSPKRSMWSQAQAGYDDFVQRYRTWPAISRFGLWAAIVLIGYMAIVDRALTQAAVFGASANANLAVIEEVQKQSSKGRRAIDKGHKNWGGMIELGELLPAGADVPLQRTLKNVLAANGINSGVTMKDIGSSVLTTKKRSRGTRTDNADSEVNLTFDQTKTQVQFQATPDVLSKILAELEMAPNVACIQRLSVQKINRQTRLDVTIVAQSWKRKS